MIGEGCSGVCWPRPQRHGVLDSCHRKRPRQRSAARPARVASIGIEHDSDTHQALRAVNPATNLSSAPLAPEWPATPCPPDTMLRCAASSTNCPTIGCCLLNIVSGGQGGRSSAQKTELKFVDRWMSQRHGKPVTLRAWPKHVAVVGRWLLARQAAPLARLRAWGGLLGPQAVTHGAVSRWHREGGAGLGHTSRGGGAVAGLSLHSSA